MMKILMYLLTFVLGILGILAARMGIVRLMHGEGLLNISVVAAALLIFLAAVCFQKARSTGPQQK